MWKSGRITLLIIPEEGGKTFELKVPRILVGLGAAAAAVVLVLLGLGFKAYVDAREFGRMVARLEREKALLEEEVSQIEQLEQVLQRLQRSNHQLRSILGESEKIELGEEGFGSFGSRDSYIPTVERLRWGHVHSVPSLWPVQGGVVRRFSATFPGTVIAVPRKSLIRASGTGQVVRAGFDARLGHLVVIDHGSGLFSQYGYNTRLLVEVGDFVQKGQPIALSGQSGEAQIPSLYFAIRENGRLRDPLDYRLWL